MTADARTTDAAASRRVMLIVGLALVAGSCGLGWWILLQDNDPFAVDVWWNDSLANWRSLFMLAFSDALNWLGGGWFGVLAVPLGVALIFVLLRKPWAAAYFLSAEAASAAGVQILKHLFGRARPEDIIVISDYGSFPSGHVANAATIAVALAVLFPRVWVIVAGTAWVLMMALSRTYLHAHWLSDTLGGAMIGTGTALLLGAVFWALVAREQTPRRPHRRIPRDAGPASTTDVRPSAGTDLPAA